MSLWPTPVRVTTGWPSAAHGLERCGHACGVGDRHPQHASGEGCAADAADLVAQVAQRIAHLGPERVHPGLVDIRDLHFGQKMRAAAQIEAKVDQRRGQELRPFGQSGGLFAARRCRLRLDRGCGVVMPFDLGVEQVRSGANQTPGANEQDQDALPERSGFMR